MTLVPNLINFYLPSTNIVYLDVIITARMLISGAYYDESDKCVPQDFMLKFFESCVFS